MPIRFPFRSSNKLVRPALSPNGLLVLVRWTLLVSSSVSIQLPFLSSKLSYYIEPTPTFQPSKSRRTDPVLNHRNLPKKKAGIPYRPRESRQEGRVRTFRTWSHLEDGPKGTVCLDALSRASFIVWFTVSGDIR